MLGMAGFDCVFVLQHSYSRDRCDTIFRIRSWTQHHPSPLLLSRKGLTFLVYPTIKQTALAQVSQQEHCARAVCMKKKNIFQLSEKNRTSTAKYAPLLERLCQREGADALSCSASKKQVQTRTPYARRFWRSCSGS